jgi:alpha-amylase
MYCRMLEVSRRVEVLEQRIVGRESRRSAGAIDPDNGRNASDGGTSATAPPAETIAAPSARARLDEARRELYRGQCNCAYWHGAFGGLYLPHLRHAIYHHLIAADSALESAVRPAGTPWVDIQVADYNLDARQEVRLANDRLVAYVAPALGGAMYELDLRGIGHNLLATLARRPEAYHRRVLEAASRQASGAGDVKSIHDLVVFKQEDLDKKLQYDRHLRKSLQDHLFAGEPAAADVSTGRAVEIGDLVSAVYEARLRRATDRVQLVLGTLLPLAGKRAQEPSRGGTRTAANALLKVTKTITLRAGASALEIQYVLEDVPADRVLSFAPEFNFAGLPAGAPGRYFTGDNSKNLGSLGDELDLRAARRIGLVDEFLGLAVSLVFSLPGGVWTFPIQTVSQSESGFELVHQSTAVLPHWPVAADSDGRWQLDLTLGFECATAPQPERPTKNRQRVASGD